MGLCCTELKLINKSITYNIHFSSRLPTEKGYLTWDAANHILEIRVDNQALLCLSHKSKAYASLFDRHQLE